MTSTAKFLFDEDFATGAKPTITVIEAERRRADAEAQAHRKGFALGQAQARGEAIQRVAATLAVIADSMTRLDQALGGIEARLETEAVEVAVAVAGKLAPALIAREPFAEISALADECFKQLVTTPHIAVRIATDAHDAAREKLEDIARAKGFEGRLMVLADATLAPGDCRIEWSDGGVDRDQAKTLSAIENVVGRYIAARMTASTEA
jgi:flagellar assembly protein FliH